ncbi:MAG: sigma-70 family RNA polymerase sigma factor [Clostridiales bacterium]|nr:sigma-70 family RNA polymerase sigma factor [Clostridiales bacterium]
MDKNTQLEQQKINQYFIDYKDTGSVELREKIFTHFSNISNIIAHRFIGRGIDYEDIVQVASVSLLRAIDRFDINRGIKFQSFAVPTMIGEIKNYFRDYNRPIKISRSSSEMIKKMKLAINELTLQLEKVPTTKQIADRLKISEEHTLELLEASNNIKVTSLDAQNDKHDENEHRVKLGNLDKGYEMVENRQLLTQSFKVLDEKEKYIIIQRFFKNKSQQVIAERLNVSQMYVSRAEKKALEKMRKEIQN